MMYIWGYLKTQALRGVCWQLHCSQRKYLYKLLNGKYEILISLILQWQDNPRKTMRNL